MKTELILCIEAKTLESLLGSKRGFVPFTDALPANSDLWLAPRHIIENRPEFKQLIPYLVLRSQDRYAIYRRTSKGGEARLHGRYSMGFGGHIDGHDVIFSEGEAGRPGTVMLDETIQLTVARELAEELVNGDEIFNSNPSATPFGYIYDDSNDVGRVHVGIVYILDAENDEIIPNEDAIAECAFVPLRHLQKRRDEMENWSQLLIDALPTTQ